MANPLFVDEGVWRHGLIAVKHHRWSGPLRHTVRDVHPCVSEVQVASETIIFHETEKQTVLYDYNELSMIIEYIIHL